jgi:hypothetical protein
MKGSSRASPLQITGSIRAKKKSAGAAARTKALGKALSSASETSDGLWRSPRISQLLDGHKTKPLSSARPPKPHPTCPDPLHRAHLRVFLSLFLGLVKFPSVTDLEKLSSPYPLISAVALQEKAAQCGVPPPPPPLRR